MNKAIKDLIAMIEGSGTAVAAMRKENESITAANVAMKASLEAFKSKVDKDLAESKELKLKVTEFVALLGTLPIDIAPTSGTIKSDKTDRVKELSLQISKFKR
jgi:hypothetical protein